MGIEYTPAIDMIISDPAWVFTDALKGLSGGQLSIVLHKTACGGPCDAVSVATFFAHDTSTRKSVHFIVGTDGTVVQVVRLSNGAGGNCCLETGHDPYWDPFQARYGNLNECTISIEHVDTTNDNSEPMTQAQINASFALVSWLVQKFGIPVSHIKGHNTLDPISRARCPGATYPMQDLLSHLQGGNVSLVLNAQGCVCDVVRSNQLFEGEMELCGPWSAKAIQLAGEPGKGPNGTAEDVDSWVDSYVTKEGFTPANFPGVSIPDEEAILKALGDHYWEIPSDVGSIRKAVEAGYPVLFTANEVNIHAWDPPSNSWVYPYGWQINANHVLPVTGIDNQGNFICPDQLSSRNPWPVIYDASRLAPTYAVVVQLPFLKSIPSGDPNTWPVGFNAQNFGSQSTPTPQPDLKAEAFAEEWGTDVKTRIAQAAYATYWTPSFAGAPVAAESQLKGKDGKTYTALRVNMGIWLDDGTTVRYYAYKAG